MNFSQNYLKAYSIVRSNEGGYLTAKKALEIRDSGGETYCGVSRKWYPNWKGWAIIDTLNKEGAKPDILEKNPTLHTLVKELYLTEFWNKLRAESVAEKSQVIAIELFDTAINMGVMFSSCVFQRTLNALTNSNLAVDGVIGEVTISVFNTLMNNKLEDVIAITMNALQIAEYVSLKEKDPNKISFIVGWIRNRGKDPFKVLS